MASDADHFSWSHLTGSYCAVVAVHHFTLATMHDNGASGCGPKMHMGTGIPYRHILSRDTTSNRPLFFQVIDWRHLWPYQSCREALSQVVNSTFHWHLSLQIIQTEPGRYLVKWHPFSGSLIITFIIIGEVYYSWLLLTVFSCTKQPVPWLEEGYIILEALSEFLMSYMKYFGFSSKSATPALILHSALSILAELMRMIGPVQSLWITVFLPLGLWWSLWPWQKVSLPTDAWSQVLVCVSSQPVADYWSSPYS